jgi:hypothetical protein
MDLPRKEGYLIKFCMKSIAVISHDNQLINNLYILLIYRVSNALPVSFKVKIIQFLRKVKTPILWRKRRRNQLTEIKFGLHKQCMKARGHCRSPDSADV